MWHDVPPHRSLRPYLLAHGPGRTHWREPGLTRVGFPYRREHRPAAAVVNSSRHYDFGRGRCTGASRKCLAEAKAAARFDPYWAQAWSVRRVATFALRDSRIALRDFCATFRESDAER